MFLPPTDKPTANETGSDCDCVNPQASWTLIRVQLESTKDKKSAMDVQRLIERADLLHRTRFGRESNFRVAAPGRVNLIGEHTDYNDGFVFPIAIERYVAVAASYPGGTDARLLVHSDAVDASVDISLGSRPQGGEPQWANYVRGVVAGFQDRGHDLPSLDLAITSSVPLGAGLSSSAALEVAIASILEAAIGVRLDPLDKARLCQTAERDYARVPCGLMDQMASVFGRREHALFIDCRSQTTTMVPLRDPSVSVLVCNTNVRHTLANGEYAKRRAECQQATQVLGVLSLRDATVDQVVGAAQQLGDSLFRRARHVVTENQRALEFADALAGGDVSRAGRLMVRSHASLRDDYQVSCRELDILVDAAERLTTTCGMYGSRMTGGGFGGCTVSLVETASVEEVVSRLTDRYREATGRLLNAFVTRPSEGAIDSSFPTALDSRRDGS
jgi:galactokinase